MHVHTSAETADAYLAGWRQILQVVGQLYYWQGFLQCSLTGLRLLYSPVDRRFSAGTTTCGRQIAADPCLQPGRM